MIIATILLVNIFFYSQQYYQNIPDIMICVIYYYAIHSNLDKEQSWHIFLVCILVDILYNQVFGLWSIYYISIYYILKNYAKLIQLYSFNRSLLYFSVIYYIYSIIHYYLYDLEVRSLIIKFILTVCSFIILSKIFSKIESFHPHREYSR